MSQIRASFAVRHRQSILLAVALTGLTAALSVVAPPHQVDAATSTSPTGRLLASNCFQCHGTNGLAGAFDELAGDGEADLFNKMKDQQKKQTIMGSHARGYTDLELRAIAKYFASVPKN